LLVATSDVNALAPRAGATERAGGVTGVPPAFSVKLGKLLELS
jgi:hypothetical protein